MVLLYCDALLSPTSLTSLRLTVVLSQKLFTSYCCVKSSSKTHGCQALFERDEGHGRQCHQCASMVFVQRFMGNVVLNLKDMALLCECEIQIFFFSG